MTTIKQNGHGAYPLPVIDFAKAAWQNALQRRQNRPTQPAMYHPNKAQKVIQRAYEDALYLAALWLADLSISKAQTTQQGLTVARWYYARALLDMARLIEGRRRDRLAIKDEATLRSRLETAYGKARAQPQLFYARVPAFVLRKSQ